MADQNYRENFELEILPHLKAAYNLARWLMLSDQDAEDATQEAYIRAFKFFASFHGGSGRSWLLKIVRNTCYTWLRVNRPLQDALEFDERFFPSDAGTLNPEEMALQNDSRMLLRKALEKLPSIFREVLVLRELEGMSYREISEVTGTPQGTVMSRLSRARGGLRRTLSELTNAHAQPTSAAADSYSFGSSNS